MAEFRAPKPTVSLKTRRGHVNYMANMLTRVNNDQVARRLMKADEATLMETHSAAVIGTFNWLMDNEAAIAAFIALPEEDRKAILAAPAVAAEAARKAMEETS
ncbi:hypothetical protein CXZ10_05950 [Pleomorphomonas diazotrophica]|uniref:Uncharacterized protein n=1 Tax=Pleomorphomonas diazotrophica TaxID=1166257 RepID=A0A1I4Q6Z6_9HYPH|nr:hypothetical protein [Pleomorphomonas diazotrophica]PKR90887.1 hypothetical protein CXZ10_05950 [Pleomorphomonas diazotrophica]SFM35878.1 hypothetical protein SAMN05192571_101121 [Pleomorphomonas diazotrophica]